MRRGPIWIATLVVTLAFGTAAVAEKPAVVQIGKIIVTFNGSASPTKLPRNEMAPISFTVSGGFKTADGTHPPALREFVFEADKNGTVNAKGLPICTAGKLQAQDTKNAEKACPTAIIGKGKTDVEVEFPEQEPFIAKSKLLAFNGGVKGGTTTIFVHAYLSSPVSAAVVTTVKVKKVHNGRYGTQSVASIPKIAGGYGSPVNFSLKVGRTFTYKGEKQSYLVAKCPDGHFGAKGTAVFADGTRIAASLVRPCTPVG